jgi:hypothetical protein
VDLGSGSLDSGDGFGKIGMLLLAPVEVVVLKLVGAKTRNTGLSGVFISWFRLVVHVTFYACSFDFSGVWKLMGSGRKGLSWCRRQCFHPTIFTLDASLGAESGVGDESAREQAG